MRYPIRVTVRDGIGRILAGSTVTVYEAGTATLAKIYAAKTGGSLIVGSVVTADARGQALAYFDETDYAINDYFDLVVAKADHETVTIPDVMA